MHLLLIKTQPHERVRRRRKLLHRPRSLADHGDELLTGISTRAYGAEELGRACAGGDPERDESAVPVRGQPGEQLVEHRVRDLLRDTAGHPRPEQAGLLPGKRVHRVVMRVRPARPGQGKRVHDRPGPGLQVIGVEAPADRLAVRHRRRRVLRGRGPLSRNRSRFRRRPDGLACELEMSAEVAGLASRRLIPRDIHGPREPEPAKQCQRVRPLRRRRTAGCLQVPQELRHRLDSPAARIAQVVRLPRTPGLDERPGRRDHERSEVPDTVHFSFSHEQRP